MVERVDAAVTRGALDQLSPATITIPKQTIKAPIAHAQVQIVRAIEAAVLEAKKPPNKWAIAVSLASPAVLFGKGIQDFFGSFSVGTAMTATTAATYEINVGKLTLAIACMCIGTGASVAAFMHWRRDSKTERLYVLAHRHICELLNQTGETPEDG